jgi:hypothetical protein
MTKEEFIEFIKELGFTQTWTTKLNHYTLPTDRASINMAYHDQLTISISDGFLLRLPSVDYLIQLSLSQMSSNMITGKNFGNFSLNTFGDKNDFQLELFLSFILGSFNEKPSNIIQYMRDRKIEKILI